MQHRILTRQLNTTATASDIYAALCMQNSGTNHNEAKTHTALFETAAVGQLHHVKSLLMLSAAVCIECVDKKVYFRALTENGVHFLNSLKPLFRLPVDIIDTTEGFYIECETANTPSKLDEETRLRAFNIFEPLRQTQQLIRSGNPEHDAVTFLFGYFAYDIIDQFEQLPEANNDNKPIPDYVYYLADKLIIRDEQKNTAELFTLAFDANANNLDLNTELNHLVDTIEALKTHTMANLPSVELNGHTTDFIESCALSNAEDFKNDIEVIREHIKAGDVFQAVLSRQFSVPCQHPFLAYQVLKQHNPSPYMFYLQGDETTLFGSSPESAVKFTAANREVTIYPIAGTHRRGTNADGTINTDLDSRIEVSLLQNQKEIAEHMMLVDLARNDIARVCKPGTRQIRELLQIVRYAHVMHIVSEVIGELDDQLDALHAYQACHNMGTLVGAPKIKATEILRGLEPHYRGAYGGAVGYLNAAGDMDTAIIIRSAMVQNQQAIIQAGAGIVLDSDPDSEALETCNKAAAVIKACMTVENHLSKIGAAS